MCTYVLTALRLGRRCRVRFGETNSVVPGSCARGGPPTNPLDELTDRERDTLALMAQGLSDKGIADRLGVSTTTVGTHVQAVFRKLDLPGTGADNRRVLAVLGYLRER